MREFENEKGKWLVKDGVKILIEASEQYIIEKEKETAKETAKVESELQKELLKQALSDAEKRMLNALPYILERIARDKLTAEELELISEIKTYKNLLK